MPQRPQRPCAHRGCPALTRAKRCPDHQGEDHRAFNRDRGSSTQQGYGVKWRRLRVQILNRDPFCKDCNTEPSTEVDHVIPKRDGGTAGAANLQGLCKTCHSTKTAREVRLHQRTAYRDHGRGRVVLVCGPPGAGKTTLVNERRTALDAVIDADLLFAAVSGKPPHDHPPHLLAVVETLRETALQVCARSADIATTWVVLMAPRRAMRERFAREFNATVVVLETDGPTCADRIRGDNRHGDALWATLINDWWRRSRHAMETWSSRGGVSNL